ncbi:MAG: hypothetical protein KDI29_13860, partial [Pseudomonadales bacterium]|nr:hypothetical protein [Pseudomonadales bacterium]
LRVFKAKAIVVAALLFAGFVYEALTASGTSSLPTLMILIFALNFVLSVSGFTTPIPFGTKSTPVPYGQLVMLLHRELYRNTESISHLDEIHSQS